MSPRVGLRNFQQPARAPIQSTQLPLELPFHSPRFNPIQFSSARLCLARLGSIRLKSWMRRFLFGLLGWRHSGRVSSMRSEKPSIKRPLWPIEADLADRREEKRRETRRKDENKRAEAATFSQLPNWCFRFSQKPKASQTKPRKPPKAEE